MHSSAVLTSKVQSVSSFSWSLYSLKNTWVHSALVTIHLISLVKNPWLCENNALLGLLRYGHSLIQGSVSLSSLILSCFLMFSHLLILNMVQLDHMARMGIIDLSKHTRWSQEGTSQVSRYWPCAWKWKWGPKCISNLSQTHPKILPALTMRLRNLSLINIYTALTQEYLHRLDTGTFAPPWHRNNFAPWRCRNICTALTQE